MIKNNGKSLGIIVLGVLLLFVLVFLHTIEFIDKHTYMDLGWLILIVGSLIAAYIEVKETITKSALR